MHQSPPITAAKHNARAIVVAALAHAAKRFPRLSRSNLDCSGLSHVDSQLAQAIHRTTLQRWISLEYLLNRLLRRPIDQLEPILRAVLLAGAAQLLCLDRLPVYAVVDESVQLARTLLRRRAGSLTNAVLRRFAALVGPVMPEQAWEPASDRLPLGAGSVILTEPLLPLPADDLATHLVAATSCPLALVSRWLEHYGPEQTVAICAHSVQNPPVFVFDGQRCELWHEDQGRLVDYLAQDRSRRVQDPGSALAVASTCGLSPGSILDFCAGYGTKTRQLATRHPGARIVATDVNPKRLARLRQASDILENVSVVMPDQLPDDPVDLVLLDVPCSNTAVLSRRPEARYRFSPRTLTNLVDLQRQIMTEILPRLRPGGHCLYSTCSLETEENQQQRDWLTATSGANIVSEQLSLPAGRGAGHRDGSYFFLAQVP